MFGFIVDVVGGGGGGDGGWCGGDGKVVGDY